MSSKFLPGSLIVQLHRPLVLLIAAFVLLFTDSALAQCPGGMVSITADRDNTLYEDASGMLSNGAGRYLFAGRTGQDDVRRGLVHFDVAGAVAPGSTVAAVSLQLVLSQPDNNGVHSIGVHSVHADWGEGSSQGGMGEGGGGPATVGDATWLHTFFSSATWSTPGGDFGAAALASTVVTGAAGGTYTWESSGLVADVQAWLDNPSTNFGWLVTGDETASGTAFRFATRENSGSEPTLCLELCPGAVSCPIFLDGFESGDTTAWSSSFQ